MTLLIGTDLDRTLIYSRAASGSDGDDVGAGVGGHRLAAVERYRDADASFMTLAAATTFAGLADASTVVVPVTTRTPEQWRRITLPGPAPHHVIAANGGVLLVDGRPDHSWGATVARALTRVAPLTEVVSHVRGVLAPEWTITLREVEGLFCYAVVDRARLPAQLVADESCWAVDRGWRLSLQGRKLYWVPSTLTKSAAFAEVADRTGATSSVAAGDSLLDADLLLAAGAGIVPRHGELSATGWSAPHVVRTRASGAAAGEEIVRWFAEQARRHADSLGRTA